MATSIATTDPQALQIAAYMASDRHRDITAECR
jgi:hypothetical protein